jgi:DNA-binding GntR family transcriptional regulator
MVPIISRKRYREIVELRLDLESKAARHATPHCTPRLLDDLEFGHDLLAAARQECDIRKLLAANEQFHFTLYRAADRPSLYGIIESLWIQVGPLMNRIYHLDGLAAHPAFGDRHEHLSVLRGLRCGDADMVCEAIRRDIQWSAMQIADSLED